MAILLTLLAAPLMKPGYKRAVLRLLSVKEQKRAIKTALFCVFRQNQALGQSSFNGFSETVKTSFSGPLCTFP